MPNKSLIVARYEFLRTVKRKEFLFIVLILPMFIILPLIFTTNYLPAMIPQAASEKIGFVDYADFLDIVGKNEENFVEYNDTVAAKQALVNDDIFSLFIISEDYFNTSKITVYSKGSGVFVSAPINPIGDFIVKNLLRYGDVDAYIAKKIENPMAIETITLDEEGNIKEDKSVASGFLLPFALATLLLLGIMTSSGYLLQGIGEEKESRTGELLLSSISADQLLRGKIIGYGFVGLLQIGIWILTGLIFNTPIAGLFAGLEISWVLGLAIIYFILGYFLFAASMACTAAISTTTKEAQQTSMIFTMFAIIPMLFLNFIIAAPDSIVAKILTLFPYTSPFVVMMRLPLVKIPLYELFASIGILVITIAVFMKLSGKIFRMGMLMYGKRASLKDIARFLREK